MNNGEDVVSGGLTYVAFPFEIALPADTEDAPPSVTLRICSVDRRVIQAIRSASGDLQAELVVVAASDPDQVEVGPLEFSLRNATYDQGVVEGTLRYENLLNEPFPEGAFTPSRTPGVFRIGVEEST